MKTGNKNPDATRRGADAMTAAAELSPEVDELRRVIGRGNRRWKCLVLLEALGLAIAAPLIYLWLMFALDSVFHLSVPARWIAGILFFAALVWQAHRLARSWRQARFTDDQVALAMERNTPGGLENRLINSVQLALAGGQTDPELRAAVVRENHERLRQAHVEQAARIYPAMVRIGLAVLAVAAGIAFRLVQPERFSTAATRILLPFAKVEPAYRTRLHVTPGNIGIKRGDDVTLRVRVEGERPGRLMLLTREGSIRMTEELRLPDGADEVMHILPNIRATLEYAVRGGDFTTPFYTIDVPIPSSISRFRVEYRYPSYSGQAPRVVESTSGDLEALAGSEALLDLTVNRPVEGLALLFKEASSTNGELVARQECTRTGPASFSATVGFETTRRYQIEMQAAGQPPAVSRAYALTVQDDMLPEVQIIGLSDGDILPEDAVHPVRVVARDDLGLREAGIFSRLRGDKGGAWEALKVWKTEAAARDFTDEWVLAMAATGAAEGDVVELMPRGRDNHPERLESWRDGRMLAVTVGGDEARLQIEYERILRAEKGIGGLVDATRAAAEKIGSYARQIESGALGRLDDQATLDRIARDCKAMAQEQAALRTRAAEVALDMPEEADAMRQSMGMLADTEMVRAVKAVESVLTREEPLRKRAALMEARATLERVQRSFGEILQSFTVYRREWELENMTPFTLMVAERQTKLGEVSLRYAGLPAASLTDRVRAGCVRRQRKVAELAGLAAAAFRSLAGREDLVGKVAAAAYSEAVRELGAEAVTAPMQRTLTLLDKSDWRGAAAAQEEAAAALHAVVDKLVKAQRDAAQALLAELQELARDDAEAQAAIKKLQEGSAAEVLKGDVSGTEISEMVALAEELRNKRFTERLPDKPWTGPEGKLSDFISGHVKGSIDQEKERDFSIMKLATAPTAESDIMEGFDTDDKLDFAIVPDYEDVVGELLDEADDIREEYESIRNMLLGQDIEAGALGKGSLPMASASASGATGNMKPDTKEHGGVSRIGRQGARASGVAAGNESINRRGRDEAQESSQQVQDIAGAIKERISEDPATDHSTGVGGRKVEGDLQKTFSVKDAGEWKDDMAERMEDPQAAYQIVERKGAPLSPEVAEQLRALEGQQEQMISRVKAVRKDLDNLFLPTDHLDETLSGMAAAMERLRKQPDAEAFRQVNESLDKMMGALMVFDRPDSSFQPSLPRPAAMRGEILDETVNPPMPGYEEQIKRYYERLVTP